MKQKFICLLIVICVVLEVPIIASANKQIELYVDDKKLIGVIPVIKSGVMYVPSRHFFNAMGYKVSYNPESSEVSVFINDFEMIFSADYDSVYYNDYTFYLDEPIPVIDGQVYFPIRLASQILERSVTYDKDTLTVKMKKYGDGQEKAVYDLLLNYYKFFTPKLLAYGSHHLYNPYYDYESNHRISEIPVRDFIIDIHSLVYSSADKADLRVTYIENTEVLNRKDEYMFEIRYENGQWKVAESTLLSVNMELPKDINETAAKVMEKQKEEQKAVLSDLRTYYKALNDENLTLTVQYRSPSFLKKWNAGVINPETELTWENFKKIGFESDEWKYDLTGEHVLFVGEKEAIVHGTIEWSDVLEGYTDVYEALIFLEYANGHWNYDDELHLDVD
ncbi:copper amine oxidase N-terminal domain-containing protein [Paenibacillus fonticola]|uniref:copper amine oxidase N-terminal domain-containing protein n=1 Tax=Paenibacillus fonticola TaxID=379896 RepID=UPI0003679F23|nr:copper amine oxidase N-terminal domain-containing protein [Paenibacillus fonticola]